MAFKLAKKNLVWWPVTISMPVDGGTVQSIQCTAQFEVLDSDEYEVFKRKSDIDFLCRVVTGFKDDIQDETGAPLVFNDETKMTLFKSAGYVRVGFIKAYHEVVSGYLEKN